MRLRRELSRTIGKTHNSTTLICEQKGIEKGDTMKLPYGLSNFDQIRTEGYWYVDKTKYVEMLETSPERFLMILRSRRFGKTLFCNMLGWYYDRLHGERFDELFQGTHIHVHPTPKRGAYLMLTFNFSGISTQTLEDANGGFVTEVSNQVMVFLTRYHDLFSQKDHKHVLSCQKPNDMLISLFSIIKAKGMDKCVYVIIDEYDHFANNILSQGKEMFKELVQTDGYVRPFYEALKKGAESVVDRIFITGVMPILLDSLTSGFNIAKNKSTDVRFNEMLGFTEEEVRTILRGRGMEERLDIVRTYYDGYRFSPRASRTVYNSDMVLFYGTEYDPRDGYIATMLDTNVVSDYRKIRAILSIGDSAMEEDVLTRIVRDNQIPVSEITPLFVLTWDTEFLFTEDALSSLLFYMGYLTISGMSGIAIDLRIPNVVLESLYLEYMQHLLMTRGQITLRSRETLTMFQDLIDGRIDTLTELTEKLLRGLSNRDYQRFDEKYVKVVMLSLLSNVNLYIPHSEYEASADGFPDIYLQAAFEPQQSAHYFIELKYLKAKATNAAIDTKAKAGRAAMRRYLQTPAARAIPNLHAYVLVFRKDRCVRKIRC